MIRTSLVAAAALVLPAPAFAQYIGGNAPPPPPAPVAGQIESPEAALARNVRLLAINPKNFEALLGAGRAALKLGDTEAAVGFFGRAEEISPQSWAPKAGQGSALALMGDGANALAMFTEAQRLGATQLTIALDRGLAFDLLGRQAEAQSDYRAVLSGPDPAEARRRLALSLGISGRKIEALGILDPLLARGDPGAKRARALILALGGDVEGARQAIGVMMPGASAGFEPFLRRLTALPPGQKAAAVHLGIMPAQGTVLASAEPPPEPVVRPSPPPIARSKPAPAPVRVAAAAPPPAPAAEENDGGDRLSDIESLLLKLPTTPKTTSAKPPPAPKPIVERKVAEAKPAAVEKSVAAPTCDRLKGARLKQCQADARKAKLAAAAPVEKADDCAGKKGAKLRACKAEAAKTAKQSATDCKPVKGKKAVKSQCDAKVRTAAADDDDAKTVKVAAGGSRIYVQLAGGSNSERMNVEFNRIKARKPALFKSRSPVVFTVKGWSRLLVGPFKDDEAAQDFVNDLHAAKLEGFAWTAPGGAKLEKLASK